MHNICELEQHTPGRGLHEFPVHNGRPLSASHEAWVSSRRAAASGVGGAAPLPGPAAHWNWRVWLRHVSFGERWTTWEEVSVRE